MSFLDEEGVLLARQHGFSIRCWGVKGEALMDKALALNIDGMTVDFPDLLAVRLRTGE